MMKLDSEEQFLTCIDTHFTLRTQHVLLGRGDDCAVLAAPQRVCLSTDLFLEDVHFRRAYFSAEEVGRKALAVNLSDLAAMGARPLGFALSLLAPPDVEGAYWDALFAGMAALAEEHETPLVGGDLSRADKLGLAITVWGEQAGERFLTRGGAANEVRPGDALFTVGEIGLARAGLMALEAAGREAALAAYPAATRAHLDPAPQLAAGRALAHATGTGRLALMDLSDGLARDLPRLLGKGQGATLALDPADLHAEVRAFAAERHFDPVIHAVTGGEDYALLGAAAPDTVETLRAAVPQLAVIGTVTDAPHLLVNNSLFSHKGFDHFAG